MIEFEIRHIRIPYRFRYGHASKLHVGLEAIVCTARDEDGRFGFGEAVPRTYVTGETCQTVMAEMRQLISHTLLEDHSCSGLQQRRMALVSDWEGRFPSCACCAIDTALWDLFSRQRSQACVTWSGGESREPLVYAASIGMSKKAKLIATLLAYRALGFKHFKVKVGGGDDVERIRLIRRILGSQVSLFADANASWEREAAVRHIESLRYFDVWAIEEPLRAATPQPTTLGGLDRFQVLTEAHYENYRWLRERSAIPLIADESLICFGSAERIVAHQAFDILNIRLSKCGGPFVSTQIVELARANGLKFAFGAMVGETPILATAGAHFAALHRDHLYVQGFSHRLLHGKKFASDEPTIRRGGILQMDGRKFGLGIQVEPSKLDALTIACERISV